MHERADDFGDAIAVLPQQVAVLLELGLGFWAMLVVGAMESGVELPGGVEEVRDLDPEGEIGNVVLDSNTASLGGKQRRGRSSCRAPHGVDDGIRRGADTERRDRESWAKHGRKRAIPAST